MHWLCCDKWDWFGLSKHDSCAQLLQTDLVDSAKNNGHGVSYYYKVNKTSQ